MVAVNYLWNPINDNIVREFDDAGNTIAEYTTEPDLYGNVVSQYRGGQTNYLHSDGQGNTTELTNDAGTVTDTIRYSAFGEVTERTGTTEIPFQYVGQKGYYRDVETSECSVRQRPLDVEQGRWLSQDRLGILPCALNAYQYTDGAPTLAIDPSGLQPPAAPPLPACASKKRYRKLPGGKCEFRTSTPKPGWKPSPNHCSAPLIGGSGGFWNFTPACDRHDICYGTCGTKKDDCDCAFSSDMLKICKTVVGGGASADCRLMALAYYNAVVYFGFSFYEAGQDNACSWAPCTCPAPPLVTPPWFVPRV